MVAVRRCNGRLLRLSDDNARASCSSPSIRTVAVDSGIHPSRCSMMSTSFMQELV